METKEVYRVIALRKGKSLKVLMGLALLFADNTWRIVWNEPNQKELNDEDLCRTSGRLRPEKEEERS